MVDFPSAVNAPGAGSYSAPLVDFSPLARLPQDYYRGAEMQRQNDRANAFQNGLPRNPDGSIDANAVADTLAKFGGAQQGLELANSARAQNIAGAFQGGLPKDAQGNIDFRAVAETLARRGGVEQLVPLANADLARQNAAFGRDAATALAGGGMPGTAPGMRAQAGAPASAPQAAPSATPASGYRGGDSGLNTVASIVSKVMPEEAAGPTIIAAAKRLGVDPNQPLSLSQATALEREVLAQTGAKPVAPPDRYAEAPQPGQQQGEPQSGQPPQAPAAPTGGGQPSAMNPAAMGDATLGGMVPQPFIKRYGPEAAAGEYVRWLRGMAVALGSAGQKGAEDAYNKQADAVQGAMIKYSETKYPPDVREYLYAKSQGETRPYTEWQAAKKGESIPAQIEARRKAAVEQGLDPNESSTKSYILTGKMPREDQLPLTATDKKAILEADEGVLSAQMAIKALTEAKSLSPQANTGYFASGRATLGNNLPDLLVPDRVSSPESSEATANYENLVLGQALSQLKSIFGAAPTEGERKILLDLQASVGKPDKVRQSILDRAIVAAEKRLGFNQQRAEELRGGTFYKSPDAKAAAAAKAERGAKNDPLAQARDAIDQGADRDAVIKRLRENGIDPKGL